jgi:hypothetical protein
VSLHMIVLLLEGMTRELPERTNPELKIGNKDCLI